MNRHDPIDPWAPEVLTRDTYERVRPRYLEYIFELKRKRRVWASDHVSLVFENRTTVIYNVHEAVRADGQWTNDAINREIKEAVPMIPSGNDVRATFMVHGGTPRASTELCERLAFAPSNVLRLVIGKHTTGAMQVVPPPSPWCPVQYLRFPLGAAAADELVDPNLFVAIEYTGVHEIVTTELGPQTRWELAQDLATPGRKRLTTEPLHPATAQDY